MRVNFDTVSDYCMEECVTYNELKPVYEMLVALMGDSSNQKWLAIKEDLKERKMKLDGKVVLLENLVKASANGKLEVVVERPVKKGAKKTSVPKLTNATFTYRYLEECPNRIMVLYQGLVKAGFIAKETKPDDFMALFEGQESDVKVKWMGCQAALWYLFKLMLEKGYVVKPEGVGQWIVVQSHFVDGRSKMFADFNKQKAPLKLKGVLERLVELLLLTEF